MKKTGFLLPLIALLFLTRMEVYSQTNIDNSEFGHNNILFFETFGGFSGGQGGGIGAGFGVNYEKNKNLITGRVIGNFRIDFDFIYPWFPLPFPASSSTMVEIAGLYGRRFITNRGEAVSLSLGVSANNFVFEGTKKETKDIWYAGVPFEANIQWFKRRVAPFRILGLQLSKNPTPFSGSIGFKMYGNISKASYVGAGLNIGLGNYRDYGTLTKKDINP